MKTHADMIPITTTHLRSLVDEGQITTAAIKPMADGFVAVIEWNQVRWILQTSRNEDRHFRTLDTAARFLGELGIKTISVDLAGSRPNRQPDLFNSQKRGMGSKTTHAAAA